MVSAKIQRQIAHIKATTGNQYMLSSAAASSAVGAPRGPNPYACPYMGSPDANVVFTSTQAQRFFSTVIYGYVRDAIVAGMTGINSPTVVFTPMLTSQGLLWPNFDTSPLSLPVNDWFFGGAGSGPLMSAGAVPSVGRPATLDGLGAAPTLVTIPNSGGKKGFLTPKGYVIAGNTNGHVVDPVNWLWWAYVNGKVTAGKAWGSSPQIKAWGAPYKGYSSILDRTAPTIIEAAVILGVTYGIASAGAAGAGASTGGGAGTGASSGTALEPTTVSTATAPTTAFPVVDTSATIGTGTALTPVAVGTGAGGGVLSTVASGAASASGVIKAGASVAAATGLLPKGTAPGTTASSTAPGAAPASKGGSLLKIAPFALGALALFLLF